jgi:O-antigen ligase
MASQTANYLLYAMGAAAAMLWGVFILQRWEPAAKRRGGQWELEGLLLICGPIGATIVAFYPSDGSGPGVLGSASRLVTNVAYCLAIIGIAKGIKSRGRKATGLVAAVLIYYFTLIVSGIGGVVPGIPEAYWLTPLVVAAFVFNPGCTREWFLYVARMVIRIVVVLSLFSPFFVPEVAFNTDDVRTLFGLDRLQGITSHPNTLGILAAIGVVLEIKSERRTRILWSLCMAAGVLLAQSSTAYIATVIGLLLVTTRFTRVLRRVTLVGAAIGSLAVITVPEASRSLSGVLTVEEMTRLLNGRTGIWDAALVGFYQNPLWGYGPTLLDENYRELYLPHFGSAGQAHNQLFQTLGEAGIFGTAALVALALVMLVYAFRARIDTAGVSVALMSIFLVRAVSETPLRPAGISLITFILIVVLCVSAYAPREVEAVSEELPAEKQPRPVQHLSQAYTNAARTVEAR